MTRPGHCGRAVEVPSGRPRINHPDSSVCHAAVAAETFDVVLVDEAGAATLAEVLLALCRGRVTGALFGDFLQLGPVLAGSITSDSDARVATWIRRTCFCHVGIRTPQQAVAADGCTALTQQFTPYRVESEAVLAGLREQGLVEERVR